MKKILVGPCIEQTKGINSNGYGYHRGTWIAANGPIPPGMEVCHVCDNPPCVNLEHLWLGTRSDNRRDCIVKGRHNTTILTEANVREIRRRYSRTGHRT